MIPEHFKQNTSLEISVFGFPVQMDYMFYWPEKREHDQKDPLVSHIEYRAESGIVSETGYRSHFFFTQALVGTDYKTIAELVTGIAENLAIENGYQSPARGQMTLF
ncbi:hypothetical protein [Sphingobacterium spiritivorum]|uniref:hypothetical protein n=1 Tax=Sphingobacterium spiritivorum TaxID=258 RepID=UPI003DA6578F